MEQELTAVAIDDETMILTLIEEIARGAGVNVVSFTSPEDALSFISENDIDMIFLDYRMPHSDGIGFLSELCSLPADIPVVAVTVFDDDAVMGEALDAGAAEFVSKPIRAFELLARIRALAALCRAKKMLRDRNEQVEARVGEGVSLVRQREQEELVFLGLSSGFRRDNPLHIRRVAEYARIIARAAGSEEDELQRVYHAALLHDAGRPAEGHRILAGNSPPGGDDLKLVQQHVQAGAFLLEEAAGDFLHEGGTAVLCIYEWYDGRGAPRGLKGDEIPFCARVIAIAEVFDCLFMPENLRGAGDFDSALSRIRERRGTQFDPALVDILIRNEDEARGVYLSGAGGYRQFFY